MMRVHRTCTRFGCRVYGYGYEWGKDAGGADAGTGTGVRARDGKVEESKKRRKS